MRALDLDLPDSRGLDTLRAVLVGGWSVPVVVLTDHDDDRLGLEALLLTRSEQGMTLYREGSALSVKAEAREVYDVSGAGDTVIAVLAVSFFLYRAWESRAQEREGRESGREEEDLVRAHRQCLGHWDGDQKNSQFGPRCTLAKYVSTVNPTRKQVKSATAASRTELRCFRIHSDQPAYSSTRIEPGLMKMIHSW